VTRRIAILTTFEGDLPFTARHPDDGAKVAAALGAQRPDWRFDTWRVSDGHWPDDDSAYDGIVITGSPASVNDDKPWIRQLEGLVRERHARCGAMLGICFGHQAIASALGGRVANSPQGLRVGTVTTRIDRHPDWMQPPQDQFTLYAAHDEQVVVLPAGADRLGGDTGCENGCYTVGRHVLALQYHPEFGHAFMVDLLDAFGLKLPPEALALGRAQVACESGPPVDAPLVWQWIAQFFDQSFQP
jgi:GMP synthase-like glutamine amidotransferase